MNKLILEKTKGTELLSTPGRQKRPTVQKKKNCPLCPGSEQMTPKTRLALPEKKWQVRAFRNLFPIVKLHEVIVESPVHDELFQNFSKAQLVLIWTAYQNRYREFQKKSKFVFLLKNHGPKAGATIAHEHSQILGFDFVPEMMKKEAAASKAGKCEFCRLFLKNRRVFENKHFAVVVPDYARMSGESWVICKTHGLKLEKLNLEQGVALLELLQKCVNKIDDYNIAYHTYGGHLHAEIYPRRSIWGAIELGLGVIIKSLGKKETEKQLICNNSSKSARR